MVLKSYRTSPLEILESCQTILLLYTFSYTLLHPQGAARRVQQTRTAPYPHGGRAWNLRLLRKLWKGVNINPLQRIIIHCQQIWALSQLRICRSPPISKKSRYDIWSKLLRNVLKQMIKEKKSNFVTSFDRFCTQFSSVFNRFFLLFLKKIRNVVVMSFILRFLVFGLWSILYSKSMRGPRSQSRWGTKPP